MATVEIRVRSEFEGDFDQQIAAIKKVADSLETFISFIQGDPDTLERARASMIDGTLELAAAVNNIKDSYQDQITPW